MVPPTLRRKLILGIGILFILVFFIICFILQNVVWIGGGFSLQSATAFNSFPVEDVKAFTVNGSGGHGLGGGFSLQSATAFNSFPVEDLEAFTVNGSDESNLIGWDSIPVSSDEDSQEEKFTIVLFTFKYKRIEMVARLLTHLNGFPNISQVLIIWSNPENTYVRNLTLPETEYPLRIFRSYKDSLNIRFSPLRPITTEAVFILDDDIFIDHQSILCAFNFVANCRVWKQDPARIVGFKARGVTWHSARAAWEYNVHPKREEVSMVLPGSAFLHKRYLWLYTYMMPRPIRQWIDEKMNCEDIAMNFLISNLTQKSPIPVLSESQIFNPSGPHTGLSSDASHYRERNECVNFFAKVYGGNLLKRIESNPETH